MGLCSGCHAGCCRSFAVPVSGADVLRIETRLGLSFWEFACRWADPEGMIARNYAPHFHFADEPETPFVICLRHDVSQLFPRSTRCQFLRESPPDAEHPLGTGTCGIYEHRPGACRAFPTKLNATGELTVIYDVPSYGRSSQDPIYSLCPRPWTPSDIDPLQAAEDVVVARYEMNFFHRLAESWNRTAGDWSVFPDFLRLVYANRVVTDAAAAAQAAAHDLAPKIYPIHKAA